MAPVDSPPMETTDATTITQALTDAMRASLKAAAEAYARGDIEQTQVGPGVWTLKKAAE